jgi:heme oxygenase (biliverdin-IX-beta and delta-forming)
MTVLDDIRRATKPKHDVLECGLDIFRRLECAASHRALMGAYYSLYAPAEAALASYLTPIPGLCFRDRLKTATLLRDLCALGVNESHLVDLPQAHMPPLRETAQALGFAYVLEGATLGGRMIRKQITAMGNPLIGMNFFDVYGPATGTRWKEFCVVLERECAGNAPAAVEGSLAGFAFMSTGLMFEGSEPFPVAPDQSRRYTKSVAWI